MWAVPASPEGIAPRTRRPAITFLGPKRSTKGPLIKRIIRLAVTAMTPELPISALVKFKSCLIASGTRGGKANHDKKATKKPTGSYLSVTPENRFGLRTPTEMKGSGVRVV